MIGFFQAAEGGARKQDTDLVVLPIHATIESGRQNEALPGFITNLSTDAYSLQQDICKDCGSLGNGEEGVLIFCLQCGEGFHQFCVGHDFVVTDQLLKQGWRCVDCMTCEKCEESTQEDQLIVCEDCHRSFHTFCCDPPLKEVRRL